MQAVITAVGPDHRGLADPIVHHVTGQGANIYEIQMYDHDEQRLFAMLLRIELDPSHWDTLRGAMADIGRAKGLSIRVWSRDRRPQRPRLAIATTYRLEPAAALLEALAAGQIRAEAAVMFGNRPHGGDLAAEHGIDWHHTGDAQGNPDDQRLIGLCDEYDVDYLILARYMRILPAATCWKFAGGRILNLHHGLLPSFPGLRPYEDAFAARMLTYGATCHFIVPELDAGNQIIHQTTFTVPPGAALAEIVRQGQRENEPRCLVEGVRRVVDREVELHFHRVVACRRVPLPARPES